MDYQILEGGNVPTSGRKAKKDQPNSAMNRSRASNMNSAMNKS
jgi:hypothetical protein